MNIQFITGAMRSGKTDEFIKRLNKISIAKLEFLVVKFVVQAHHEKKTPFVSFLNSRRGATIACHCIDSLIQLKNLIELNPQAKIVGIDEVHMANPDEYLPIVEFVVKNDKISNFILSGLSLSYKGDTFLITDQLKSHADDVFTCKAICDQCKGKMTDYREEAIYNFLLDDQKYNGLADNQRTGDDEYVSLCRSCFLQAWRGKYGKNWSLYDM